LLVPHFEMTVEPFARGVCVQLSGELDVACAYTFDTRMREVEERDPHLILLDLRRLGFMDSAGLARILATHRRGRRAGRRVVLTRGSRAVQRVLALAAVDNVLEIVAEPEAVLA
jgi:anti-anti-sigma factor